MLKPQLLLFVTCMGQANALRKSRWKGELLLVKAQLRVFHGTVAGERSDEVQLVQVEAVLVVGVSTHGMQRGRHLLVRGGTARRRRLRKGRRSPVRRIVRSDHGSLAAERSFGAVQTVRIFAPLPKPLTRHAKTSELRIRTLGNGSSGGLQTCLAR